MWLVRCARRESIHYFIPKCRRHIIVGEASRVVSLLPHPRVTVRARSDVGGVAAIPNVIEIHKHLQSPTAAVAVSARSERACPSVLLAAELRLGNGTAPFGGWGDVGSSSVITHWCQLPDAYRSVLTRRPRWRIEYPVTSTKRCPPPKYMLTAVRISALRSTGSSAGSWSPVAHQRFGAKVAELGARPMI